MLHIPYSDLIIKVELSTRSKTTQLCIRKTK
uniref:Uncharacterized protein n=1 Tax=Anguilla anguilla TaxID=7936 RepID=A0A0E9V4J9_ANGAN